MENKIEEEQKVNILTDEEMEDYKRLKEKERKLQERLDKKYKEKSELLQLVIFG